MDGKKGVQPGIAKCKVSDLSLMYGCQTYALHGIILPNSVIYKLPFVAEQKKTVVFLFL